MLRIISPSSVLEEDIIDLDMREIISELQQYSVYDARQMQKSKEELERKLREQKTLTRRRR